MINFRYKNKTVIGLTGAIASGKSAAAAVFAKAGAEVICSDSLAAKHYALQLPKIERYFKTKERGEIADIVFKKPAARKWLEALLHPLITKEAKEIIKNTRKRIIVFDMPLLFEAGFAKSFDLVVCVYSGLAARRKRAAAKGVSPSDFKRRDAAQKPLEQKAALADVTVYNEAAKKDLEAKILKFYKVVKG